MVDPTGARDGLAAGFLAGQLRGWSLQDSLRLGALVGSLVVAMEGDYEGIRLLRRPASYWAERSSGFKGMEFGKGRGKWTYIH